MKQKDYIKLGDVIIQTALPFEKNYRERSPVIAEVIQGNDKIRSGQVICVHHNHFYPPSPYFMMDDLFSIPFNHTIFGTFNSEGNLTPVCGNMICEKIDIETSLSLPPEQRKKYIDRYLIKDSGWTFYKPDQLIFTRTHAGYEIVYNWNKFEKRIVKVHESQVCGVVR